MSNLSFSRDGFSPFSKKPSVRDPADQPKSALLKSLTTLVVALAFSSCYAPSGHHDTTFVVAKIAGLSNWDAHRLSYFSQAPDNMSFRYSAPSVGIWAPFTTYRHRIVNVLHSLHGGDATAIAQRRSGLHRLIARNNPHDRDSQWKTGFLIHAYGDSYAHTHGEKAQEQAYGETLGHVLVKKEENPDDISRNPGKYKVYANALYDALNSGRGDPKKLQEFLAAIDQASNQGEKRVNLLISNYWVGGSVPDNQERIEAWNKEVEMDKVDAFLGEVEEELRQPQETPGTPRMVDGVRSRSSLQIIP